MDPVARQAPEPERGPSPRPRDPRQERTWPRPPRRLAGASLARARPPRGVAAHRTHCPPGESPCDAAKRLPPTAAARLKSWAGGAVLRGQLRPPAAAARQCMDPRCASPASAATLGSPLVPRGAPLPSGSETSAPVQLWRARTRASRCAARATLPGRLARRLSAHRPQLGCATPTMSRRARARSCRSAACTPPAGGAPGGKLLMSATAVARRSRAGAARSAGPS